MPSYNEIDGVFFHANRWLLNDVLRGEWGSRVLVSDYYGVEQPATLTTLRRIYPRRRYARQCGGRYHLPDATPIARW